MLQFIKQSLQTDNQLGSLMIRAPMGIIFMAHGAQKLFGWFGGYGLEGTGKFMASIGLEPGYLMALMAGGAEFFGGLLILIGLLTRAASVTLAITMVVAIFAVHFEHGLFLANKGYEFGLALLSGSLALVFLGGGRFSLDRIVSNK